VHAGRREQNCRMRAREVDGLPRAALARSRHDDLRDAGRARLRENGIAIGVKTVMREVGADVDELHRDILAGRAAGFPHGRGARSMRCAARV
jgi:hypothetical protein